MSNVTANGKAFTLENPTTLNQFLENLKLNSRWVVVELNGQPLARDLFAKTQLQNGDKLEIVTPIAGG